MFEYGESPVSLNFYQLVEVLSLQWSRINWCLSYLSNQTFFFISTEKWDKPVAYFFVFKLGSPKLQSFIARSLCLIEKPSCFIHAAGQTIGQDMLIL